MQRALVSFELSSVAVRTQKSDLCIVPLPQELPFDDQTQSSTLLSRHMVRPLPQMCLKGKGEGARECEGVTKWTRSLI